VPRLSARRALAAGALAALACGPAQSAERPSLAGARRWAVVYGSVLSQESLTSLDLAVLDPDSFSSFSSSLPLRVAYVSGGEADEQRAYWAEAKGKSFLVEDNPDWPGAHRADLRSGAWRRIVLKNAGDALARGYHGLFIDTLDTAEYLESKDAKRFAGSVAAARDLLGELRSRWPKALLLVNNGFAVLETAWDLVDGVVVEDLYTRCPPKGGACSPTPAPDRDAKEAALRRFRGRSGKPVFVLLYSSLEERDSAWIAAAVRRCLDRGFLPYLTDPSLRGLGRVAPADAPR